MARKFLLIDQSISSLAGHYYEYAMHVLQAAERAGFEPYLATHQRFASSVSQSRWKTFPIFRFAYWVSPAAGKGLLDHLAIGVSNLRFRYRLAYHYSFWGLLWAVRHRITEFLLRQPLNKKQLAVIVALASGALVVKLLRLIALILLFPFAVLLFLWRAMTRLLHAGGFPEAYVRSLTADWRDVMWLVRDVSTRRNDYLRWWGEFKALRTFRADMERLLREVPVGPGDVVFIPTISAIEFMGFADALKDRPPGPSWNLLFRRDIYPGRCAGYAAQEWRVQGLRNTLAVGKDKLTRHDVRFLTDTDELTEQYNRLDVYPFATAPIPHTHPPALDRAPGGPLRIIYLGDARREKGYQFIPKIIEDLWSSHVLPGKISFHLQSNFNIPGGEPEAAIAREQLMQLASRAPGRIELLLKPLTSGEYKQLLLSADVNLLLYDPENYYARSSGILVESLSAGIPVIAPANTWLSRQYHAEVVRWRQSLASHSSAFRAMSFSQLRWQTHGSRQSPLQGQVLSIRPGDARSFVWLRVPLKATHMLVTFQTGEEGKEVSLYIDQLDTRGATLGATQRLVEVGAQQAAEIISLRDGVVMLWLGMSSSMGNATIQQGHVTFFVWNEAAPRPPFGAVGESYTSVADVSDCLRQIVDNYQHYRQTATTFAARWQQFHNADQLMLQLALPKEQANQ